MMSSTRFGDKVVDGEQTALMRKCLQRATSASTTGRTAWRRSC